jgi:hypothetical protein
MDSVSFMRMCVFIYIIIKTLVWRGVLHMFYTAAANTIVLTPLYIGLSINHGITPNGSLRKLAGICRKTRHPP